LLFAYEPNPFQRPHPRASQALRPIGQDLSEGTGWARAPKPESRPSSRSNEARPNAHPKVRLNPAPPEIIGLEFLGA